MGLDMYLEAETYVAGYGEDEPTRNNIVTCLESKIGQGVVEDYGVTVKVTVAYWRKANAIHDWFVNNVQNGEDNCAEYKVTRKQLEDLHEVCLKVLGSWEDTDMREEIAMSYLPTTNGFFFGSTEIDEWYKNSIEYTRDKIRALLGNTKLADATFYYSSSW
jgi:hypothetical protein